MPTRFPDSSQHDGAPPAPPRAAAFLPPSAVLTVRLSPPPLPPAKLRRILPALLASELPFPADTCVWRFERGGGAVLAHVARRSDVAAFLSSLRAAPSSPGPRFLVPPGPAAWRLACAERPLPQGSPRAVVFLFDERQGVLDTGRGDDLESVAVFARSSSGDCARRIRMALGPDAPRAAITVAGRGAADFAAGFPDGLSASPAADPETFADRVLALRPALEALDLRAPAAAAGAVPPHPLEGRARSRAVVAAAAAALAACAFFCAAEFRSAAAASASLRQARLERREAVDRLAGYRVSARGEAAVREAAAAAAARRDPALARPDAAADAPRVAEAALSAGVRLAHVDLRDSGVAASGTAPEAAAARRFVETLRAEGLRAALAEAPKPSGNGGAVSFFVQPSGEDAR